MLGKLISCEYMIMIKNEISRKREKEEKNRILEEEEKDPSTIL